MKGLRTLVKCLLPLLLLVVLTADGDPAMSNLPTTGEFVDQIANSVDEVLLVNPVAHVDRPLDLEGKITELCEALAAGEEIDADWAVTDAFCSMVKMNVRLTSPTDGDFPLDLHVAVLSAQRYAGYQNIGPEIVKHTGMLFVHPAPVSGAFHMCNVREPLWVFWFRPDGTLLDATLMQPGRSVPSVFCTDNYGPKVSGSYLFAIELGEAAAKPLLDTIDRLEDLSLVIEPWMTL